MNRALYVGQAVRRALLVLLLIGLLPISGLTHVRPAQAAYVNRFSTLANGAVTFTGNTMGLSKRAGANAPGTVDGIGAFISTNGALRDATFPLGTSADWRQNSSTAQLAMPPGSSVLHASLVWSGSYSYGGEDVSSFLGSSVSFATPGGSFAIAPEPSGSTLGTKGPNGTCASDADGTPTSPVVPCFYVRWADVTTQVRAGGAGAYTVGGVPGTQADTPGSAKETGNNAGWTLAVVYQNASLPARNLTLFVGDALTNSSTSTPVTIDGFCTPLSGPVSGRLFVSASEGDANRVGDQLQFGQTAATLVPVSGPNNPLNNFFGSQINDDSGQIDTSGTFGARNHNSRSGANVAAGRQGWDITSADVTAQLTNSQRSAVTRGTSTGDQYVVNALATQINIGAPSFPPEVKSVDKTSTFVGDTLTYSVLVKNEGSAEARDVRFFDTPPPGTSFISGTFTIDGVAQPGANPQAGVPLGNIAFGTQRQVTFRARVTSVPSSFEYVNQASWTYNFVSCADQPPLDGSVTTNPVVTRIAAIQPVKSVIPTGPAGAGQTLTYEIRVPNKGAAPTAGSTLADAIPAGTTYLAGSTTLNGIGVPDLPGGTMPFTQERPINSPGAPDGQIDAGAEALVQFRVTVNPNVTSEVENIALVDIDGPAGPQPPTPARAFSPVVNLRATKADQIVGDVAPPGGSPGDTIEYGITIFNSGSGAASDVTFSDPLPSNTSYVTGSTTLNGAALPDLPGGVMPFTQAQPINSPGAPAGQIAPNSGALIGFRVRVNNPIARGVSQIANQGTVTSREQPVLFTDDPSTPSVGDPTITPIAAQPELSADKAAQLLTDRDRNGVVSPGDTLRYSVTLANTGNTEAIGLVYTDTPDQNGALVAGSVTTTQGTVVGGNNGAPPIVVNVGSMPAPSGKVTITYDVVVASPLPVGVRELVNQGVLASSDLPVVLTNDPSTPQPNDPTRVPVLAAPVLTADKAVSLLVDADNDKAASPGDTLIYQVSIRNAGNTAAIGVLYTDTPDQNTTLVPGSVQTSAGTILGGNNGAPPVAVQIGTLGVGNRVTISYRVTINSPLPPSVTKIENQGLLTSDNHPPVKTNDPTSPVPGDPTTIPVVTRAELVATKVDSLIDDADRSGGASAGDLLLYQLTLRNIGNTAALTVTLDDTPDPNTSLVAGSVQASQGTVTRGNSAGDSSVAVALDAIPGAGGSATVSFVVRINNPLPSSVTQVANQGLVSAGNAPAVLSDDPDTPAAGDPTVTPISAAPAIEASKVDDLQTDADGDGQASPGDTLRYTIVVRNTGVGAASALLLDDTPDANTSLITGTVRTTLGSVTRGNSAGDSSVAVDFGGMAAGGSATVVFAVRVNDPLPEQVRQVANQARLNGNFPSTLSDDPDTPAASDPTVTPLLRAPRISASKTDALAIDADGNGAPSPGDTLLYQISLSNTGSASANNVVFTDTPDVRAIISDTLVVTETNVVLVVGSVQTSQGTVTQGNASGDGSVAVALGSLPARTGRATISFKVTIKQPLPATVRQVSNQGVVSGDFPSVPTDDPDTLPFGDPTITPIVLEPRISADKRVSLFLDADSNGYVSAGDTLSYSVDIKSFGNTTALGLVYTDTLDPNTALVVGSVQSSQGQVTRGNRPGDSSLAVDLGDLPPGAGVAISYRAQIDKPLPASVTLISNQGLVTGSNIPDTPTDDPTTPTPGDPTDVPVTPTPLLSAEKADYLQIDADKDGKPSAGDTLQYLITISNRGAVAASNVSFTDNPTQFFNNVIFKAGTVKTSQGTIVRGNAIGDTTLEIAIGSIPPGATVRVNFDVQTKQPASPSFAKNQGLVSSPDTPDVLTDDPDTSAPSDPTITLLPPAQGPPTAVQLISFRGERQGSRVAVSWATAAELNSWGFLLFRGGTAARGAAVQATPSAILARGRGTGAAYAWIDTSPPAGTIYYWLQEIELSGATHEYGPITVAGQ